MLEDAAGIRRVVLACGTVDLRKGIDGLAMIIGDQYGQNPFEKGTLFLFCGKRSDRCKGLLNITARRSRQSGVARATCPDQRSHLLIVTQPEQDLDHIPLSWKGLLMDRCSRC